MTRIDPRQILPILDMYSRLAWRLANEADGLSKDARALQLQIDATISDLYKESRKEEGLRKRFWHRLTQNND